MGQCRRAWHCMLEERGRGGTVLPGHKSRHCCRHPKAAPSSCHLSGQTRKNSTWWITNSNREVSTIENPCGGHSTCCDPRSPSDLADFVKWWQLWGVGELWVLLDLNQLCCQRYPQLKLEPIAMIQPHETD